MIFEYLCEKYTARKRKKLILEIEKLLSKNYFFVDYTEKQKIRESLPGLNIYRLVLLSFHLERCAEKTDQVFKKMPRLGEDVLSEFKNFLNSENTRRIKEASKSAREL